MIYDIAFVTVNFNTVKLLSDILAFFSSAELPFSYRLIVVDNGSTDGSKEFLEKMHGSDSLVYIQASENLGYGRAMNLGLGSVDGRYACIMNTDVLLNIEALSALWSFLEGRPDVGVASPLILGADGRQQGFLFHPGIMSVYSQTVCKMRSKLWKKRVERASAPLPVPGVLGAFFVIRRSSFPEARLFDEDFFFYYEDTELAHRYWSAGIPCYVLPNVSIVHLGGQSTSASGGKLFQQSRRKYVSKLYGERHAIIISKLDSLRIYMKFFKYRLLRMFYPSSSVLSKYDYYSRLAEKKPA